MTASVASDDVLAFWFADHARALWFATDPAFDAEIRGRFAATVEAAAQGALAEWLDRAEGALALVILLDQFPRNMYRGTPGAFGHDPRAREVADQAIARGHDVATALDRRAFFYLPFEHSESLVEQQRSLALFAGLIDSAAKTGTSDAHASAVDLMTYAQRHHDIVARFGRFPHRNQIVGRASTPEELAFLQQPNSSF